MNKGFIKYIVIIIAAIILLKFWLHIDVIAWLNKPEVKDWITGSWKTYVQPTLVALIKYIREIVT